MVPTRNLGVDGCDSDLEATGNEGHVARSACAVDMWVCVTWFLGCNGL